MLQYALPQGYYTLSCKLNDEEKILINEQLSNKVKWVLKETIWQRCSNFIKRDGIKDLIAGVLGWSNKEKQELNFNQHSNFVYLPLRSLGDFMITVSVLKQNCDQKIPCILPLYLREFYNAVGGDNYFTVIGTIDYKDQPAYFELYKVKDAVNFKRLVSDLALIKSALKTQYSYLMDYSSRRLSFTGNNMVWPSPQDNIHEGKLKMLQSAGFINEERVSNQLQSFQHSNISKILIIPDSKVKAKSIDCNLVNHIVKNFGHMDISVAYFSNQKSTDQHHLCYSNFESLMQLIAETELVVCAESLPYHLAYFLNKPHYVIYTNSQHFKATFMTPFMVEHQSYSFFNGSNDFETIDKLKEIISAA